ncbi:macrolide ABC transporter ATP-binding protein [Candidatus Saccharibacteria bacterium CG11_big_fil_rev_8_21_14_0_20_41_19]|nr:ABC transporter ATP-binding protein [Candidatus Saccharibacteria bacterium]OIP86370.1 MAG: macrolide ABC transporter ATP-binding protein [Candidatus Saccharibacteria bacterium CG2_30_41_52]PIQ71153.1 MAG: macrolide ABC transporter ATP-binding protein [Candidatus Saccharibacteria bacterium CG11_big_fil_rev_8_21_14_0_20_41_19]PIZ59969.1 MAG: macrolide ABC transporter ATP-binding protein [Candidatus Saccharibacteria bacterium CG_4_10_14_0_2_um_filter_41_11]PJC29998.1 MAG: macrolide ABC transpor
MKPIIITHNLQKSYQLGTQLIKVLDGISITINQGEFVALMGPSGSGKSTLMNLLGCLDSPTSGEYILEGVNIESKTDDELAEIKNQKIGFVFQTFNLLPKLTTLENVTLPSLYGPEDETERAKIILKKVGLSDRLNHKPNELSGGQRQRVAIARALLMDPPIIFADEPTGNLDSKSGAEIIDIFQKLNKDGKTIIMVTHDPSIAAHAQRIIHLKDGLIID